MVKVWDIFVRFSHWAVALGFFVAYLTEDDLLTLHVWAGYLVGVLVVLRLAWGLVGPKHARFSDFIAGPRRVLAYLMKLAIFRAPRHLGHSPAGGAMAIVLWLGLAAVVWSGLEVYAVEEGRGPLASSSAISVEGAASKGGGGSVWEEIHEVLANLVMILVVLHIVGVLLACLAHRENLVRAMVDGRKREL
jgi:cytochrome b